MATESTSVGTVHYEPPPGLPPGRENAAKVTRESPALVLDERERRLVSDVKDYQLTHGNQIKLVGFEDPYRVPSTGVNVSVAPTPFPRHLYDEAVALQHCMNELYIRAAMDDEWLYSVLKPEIEGDPQGLLASLWDVHVKSREAGMAQEIVSGCFRSDYMLHEGSDGNVGLKQVEMNTFSVAGGCHSELVAGFHRHLSRKLGFEAQGNEFKETQLQQLPRNTNITSITTGLAYAHYAYSGARDKRPQVVAPHPMCVLMPVQPFNVNVADERPIEYGLWDRGIPCYRCEWLDILNKARLDENRTLLFKPQRNSVEFVVSVVYYRAGYDAAEYFADGDGRSTRLMLELSSAIKCPDVVTHLVGMKAVQEALAQPGVAESFLTTPQTNIHHTAVRNTFMPMYTLGNDANGKLGRRLATNPAEAANFVLKPNLEGGGHNVFGEDIPDFLSDHPETEWDRYVLQRRIQPPEGISGLLLLADELYEGPVVSEIGILGFAMWKRSMSSPAGARSVEMIRNEAAGWTFKSKPTGLDEMSVVKGYGCFDCPLLV